MEASVSDGLDLIRTDIQLELRRYKRRVQASAETDYEGRRAEYERTGTTFNHLEVAKECLAQAKADWLGIGGPQKAIEQ